MALKRQNAVEEADLVLGGEVDENEVEVAADQRAREEDEVEVKLEDPDEDEDLDEEQEPPYRIAERVAIMSTTGQWSDFLQVEPSSGHRFYADVRSSNTEDLDHHDYILSEQILDASVSYEPHGLPYVLSAPCERSCSIRLTVCPPLHLVPLCSRLWLTTKLARYQVESVESPSKAQSAFILGVLVQLILRLRRNASLDDLEDLLSEYRSQESLNRPQRKRLRDVKNANNWLILQGLKSKIAFSHVIERVRNYPMPRHSALQTNPVRFLFGVCSSRS